MYRFLSGCALSILGTMGSAETLTITYDDLTCSTTERYRTTAQTGGISYNTPNMFLYSECGGRALIGDDGFSSQASIWADEDTLFDVQDMDLSGYANVSSVPLDAFITGTLPRGANLLDIASGYYEIGRDLSYRPTVSSAPEFEQFTLQGLRDGEVIAQHAFNSLSSSDTLNFGAFTGLDRMQFSMRLSGYPGFGSPMIVDGDRAYGCFGRCGSGTMDNVVLTTYAANTTSVAPVPVPASLATLSLALAGLGLIRRRRSA